MFYIRIPMLFDQEVYGCYIFIYNSIRQISWHEKIPDKVLTPKMRILKLQLLLSPKRLNITQQKSEYNLIG